MVPSVQMVDNSNIQNGCYIHYKYDYESNVKTHRELEDCEVRFNSGGTDSSKWRDENQNAHLMCISKFLSFLLEY